MSDQAWRGPEQRSPPPQPGAGPSDACLSAPPEGQSRAQNPRRCLDLDKLKKWVALSPEQQGRNMGGTVTLSRHASSCCHPKVASSLPQGDRKGGRSRLTLLDMAENSSHCDCSGRCPPSPLTWSLLHSLAGTRSVPSLGPVAGASAVGKRDAVLGLLPIVAVLLLGPVVGGRVLQRHRGSGARLWVTEPGEDRRWLL